jgi:probable rRNA maturation factor
VAPEVFVSNDQDEYEVDSARWAALASETLRAEGLVGEVELSVLFVDAAQIAVLNEQFLGHEGPTDVLSFPIEDAPGPGTATGSDASSEPTPGNPSPAPLLLGDVVICPEVAARNAPEHAGTYDEELALLLVHGILHLLGMDHEADEEAEAMERREQELLEAHFRSGAGQ